MPGFRLRLNLPYQLSVKQLERTSAAGERHPGHRAGEYLHWMCAPSVRRSLGEGGYTLLRCPRSRMEPSRKASALGESYSGRRQSYLSRQSSVTAYYVSPTALNDGISGS